MTTAGSSVTVPSATLPPFTTQPAATSVYIQMRITSAVFSVLLTDPSTQTFQNLEKQIKKMFSDVYNCSNCPTSKTYIGVYILSFSSGSVIANTLAEFKASETVENAKAVLDKALASSSGKLSGLEIGDVRVSSTPIPDSSPAAVPGWGIALLVLVSLILLLAIIFLVVMFVLLCRRRSRGYMDVFATRGSYHSMNDYTAYQTHGRYVAPSKYESSGNGMKNQHSYSNQGLETNDL
ncbi:hypothetical protein GDO78_016933 [Eleutherodactylus coqui]|uniref:Mucin-1 n=1 Tax=Eleutherodactylus coqui TaxID=57060 RepID=A0A8J6EJV8_ELECQ|nr:hypothetical protein GDO78_016933 [Eleutherodactylus coqui]